jgi:hypothetical protein
VIKAGNNSLCFGNINGIYQSIIISVSAGCERVKTYDNSFNFSDIYRVNITIAVSVAIDDPPGFENSEGREFAQRHCRK